MQSVRKDLIELLSRIASEKDFPIKFSSNASLSEIRLVADLIDQGFLDGDHVENEKGVPCQAMVTGITLAGREYVDELEEQHFKKSTTGKMMSFLKYVGVFVLGIIGTLIAQWLGKKLGLN